ncbi:flagellar export protein FliJ [Thiomicrorhabdus sp. 6S2-11]|jgi:flagellar FliJ protein|uniref:Flagellar FliJ protein n=1 Tax=Thiomicrorhabdus marina TaxID=2818442 RepID=A0ABS3Q8G4_9GAMM|nr:flagellar export protein FliJ [Thiomicrorhabdus marina]MBO1928373.1 flagellar export protein FliJ [Thiomicrorhabdus marina]
MSSDIQRWNKLVELAEMEMDNAGKTVAFMQEEMQQAQSQLEALQNYVQEYAQQPVQGPAQSVAQLQTHAAFGEKLHQAIQAQSEAYQQKQLMVEKALEAWREKRARFKALQTLLEKKRKQRDLKLNRQEQKMLDELAAQQVSNHSL